MDKRNQTLVAQLGARRHYGVAVALQGRGALAHLYTDLTAGPVWLQGAMATLGHGLGARVFSRWAGRAVPGVERERITEFPVFGLRYRLRVRWAKSPGEKRRAWLWGGRVFCERVLGTRPQAATSVYGFSSAVLELLEDARSRGAIGIVDHATAPVSAEAAILNEEEERFPGWRTARDGGEYLAEYNCRQAAERRAAHVVVCASSFVQGLVAAEDGTAEKIRVVPLGINVPASSSGRRSGRQPGPLRVLFVGDDGLRKGVAYLAGALRHLRSAQVEARAVGELGFTERALGELRGAMALVGSMARSEMAEQYAWADVLALPSLSDTFAIVSLEAMAAGVPVITTPNTGAADVIREGESGFVVPVRSPEAIAEKLDQLAGDPTLLSEMSRAATRRVADFSLDCYARRLCCVVDEAHAAFGSERAGESRGTSVARTPDKSTR